MKRVFKFSILMAVLMVAMTSCEEDKNVAVTGISLSQTGPVTIAVDGTLPLTATVEPSGANQSVVWTTDMLGVVQIKDGVVTGLLPGTVTITATSVDGAVSASIEVSVTNILIDIAFVGQQPYEVPRSQKRFLPLAFIPHSALNIGLKWVSSDSNVVAIDEETGEVTAGAALGEVTITATSLDDVKITANCILKVVEVPVEGIALNRKTLVLEINGKSPALPYTFTPSSADNQAVSWSSDKPEIAEVDPATGEITGVAPGKATITVTTDDGGFTDDCIVSVLYPNLLLNASFEEPASGNLPIQDWEIVPEKWFEDYYGSVLGYNANGSDRQGFSGNAFFATGNGAFFAPYLSGVVGIRNQPNMTSGFYQTVSSLEPGKYRFSADFGFRKNNAPEAFNDKETIKILSVDGLTLIAEVKIPGDPAKSVNVGDTQVELDVAGEFTLNAPTDVRFQIDLRNYPDPDRRSLVVVDNCQLRKVVE